MEGDDLEKMSATTQRYIEHVKNIDAEQPHTGAIPALTSGSPHQNQRVMGPYLAGEVTGARETAAATLQLQHSEIACATIGNCICNNRKLHLQQCIF